MNAVFTVARKEVVGLFQSSVALLFLGVFELVTLFTFFSASRFFARNLADVRPLFAWLPLLLVFLTAAVTMRAWAEERKLGTLEVLMTLPVDTKHLVLGKFVASTALVAVALLLTLPLPIMVSALGPLDPGPVVGGYLGALLLGALYVSVGLCISARTDNQVVALLLTLLVGGAMYLVGSDVVTSLASTQVAEVLRGIGTGSRFASIERGVIDLRDLVYYGGLTTFFLVLNTVALERDRVDGGGVRGRAEVRHLWLLTALVGLNTVAAVVWLTPITQARIDLTEDGDYTIHPVTRQTLATLHEPLFITGYFSERTHPKLAPLVPQLRDLLEEYAIHGQGRVVVEVADPNQDEALEQELAEQHGIRSIPFQVDDRHQSAVVNAFFHVLVRYGDQTATLSFDDLIEVYANADRVDVKLRNPEYDLTRAIKRVSQDFQGRASVLAALPEPATLTLYATPATVPDSYGDLLEVTRTLGTSLADEASTLTFSEVDPTGDPELQERLFQDYGLRPLALDLFATDTFYFELVLTMGSDVQRIAPRPGTTQADLEQAVEASLKRLAPGQLTTVGLLTEIPEAPPPNPQIPPQFQPPTPRPDYNALAQVLGDTYQVEPITLQGETPEIPPTIDVLLVGKTGPLSDVQRYAVDQFLMRGGSVLALAGSHGIDVSRGQLDLKDPSGDLADLLGHYGVTVSKDFVVDEQNAAFPRPVQVRRGGMVLQRVELQPYPFLVDVRQDGLARSHPATAGVTNITVPWASPLSVDAPDQVEVDVLASTSDRAWTYGGTSLEPPTPPGTRAAAPVIVALSGRFPSAFTKPPAPHPQPAEGADAVARSLPDAKLAVIGSSEFVSDLLMSLASSPGGEVHRGNEQLLRNLIDWTVEDTDLLQIRSAGAYARTLDPLDDDARSLLELVQYGLALLGVLAIGLFARHRRERMPTLTLPTSMEA